MTVFGPGLRAAVVALACGMALGLAGCSMGSHTPDADTAETALPTPTPRVVPPDQVLRHRVDALLAVPAVSVDEDLQTGGTEVEVRLTWSTHGSVVDASSLPIGYGSGPGYEVFRSPGALLQRPAGTGNPCWSAGGDHVARFDQRVVQEIAVLRSARATGGDGDLLKGTVSAQALLGVLGSAQLAAPASARVPATFGTSGDELEITTGWGALAKAAGAKAQSGTWLLRFRPFGTTGPRAPGADMMCP
ncbi:MAG TPA: hypothetical protein VH085_13575 [Nocardioides sp.]|nr:hypothetical protein [Nocardioides sp.]